ncbi:MAG TPA: hypothetical protein VIK53_02505 [Verrucomicrobiae bacterium]
MQKSNLKSSWARIKIKAHGVATRNITAIDRQTGVTVDIAEHIATKTALRTGADILAERLLPKLPNW